MNIDSDQGPPEKEDRAPHQDPASNVEVTTTNGIKKSTVRCRRCSRPLRAVVSQARSCGPVCWRKHRTEAIAA